MEASALTAPAVLTRTRAGGRFLRLRSDEQLVALFRAGDETAFQAIHDRYRQRLFAYARQMLSGSQQDAEDAMQDVFLRAYGALRANERPVSLRAWLYRVAHNRCIDQIRRPVPAAAEIYELSRRPEHDPFLETERREDLRQLVVDVRNLPEQQRSALLMREMEGLTYADLATALDVTVPAVKSLLVRARIGLVEAVEARNTACVEIRDDIMQAHDRGVRASGRTRRHLRECSDCRSYRTELKHLQVGIASLNPGLGLGPIAGLAQLVGWGGAGTSAAAGGGLAVVGGGTAVTKVAVVVCCAAITAGGAATEVRHRITAPAPTAEASGQPASRSGSAGGAAAPAALAPLIRELQPISFAAVGAALTTPKRATSRRAAGQERLALASTPLTPAGDEISPHAEVDLVAGPSDPPLSAAPGGVAAPAEDPVAAQTPVAEADVAVDTTITPSGDAPTVPASTPSADSQDSVASKAGSSPADDELEPAIEGSPGGAAPRPAATP